MNIPEDVSYSADTDASWWRQASVYQIYPRSFSDSDGLGDDRGITAKVPYLKALGIGAVRVSPFCPSALADGGYDIDDYRNVDPRTGTLTDLDELAAALEPTGIRIVIDIVPNRSSDRDEWVQDALAAPKGSDARKRYIFRDGLEENGGLTPSDGDSTFGGPAWERITEPDGTPRQCYMHLFAKEQPHLNWDNAEVRADFLRTLRVWSDRGTDRFRIDVAHALVKDLSEPLPYKAELLQECTGVDGLPDGLNQAFNFDLLLADFDAKQFRAVIDKNLAEAASSGTSFTWLLSNHDVVRHPARYGLPQNAGRHCQERLLASDVDTGLGLRRRARAASLLMSALPGSVYLYQGAELGLEEVGDIAAGERQDPAFFRNPGVDTQDKVMGSTLELHREALRYRRHLRTEERLTWVSAGDAVLHFVRPNGWQSVTNFGTEPVELPAGIILLSSGPLAGGKLPANTTAWIV